MLLLLPFIMAAVFPLQAQAKGDCPTFLNHDLVKLHSDETVNLCDVAFGKPILVINTASYCGFTAQFEGLEALHQKYQSEGLFVVGFASDDFNQEANSEEEAAKVCRLNYGVTFTMIAPSAVKGDAANPVFQQLNKQTQSPSWNFNKYLIDSDGKVVQYFQSQVAPESEQLTQAIKSIL